MKTVKKTVVPLLVISVFMFYLGAFIIDGVSLVESVSHSLKEYEYFFKTIFKMRNPIGSLIHLWYLYIYILVMLTFPVLQSFVDYIDENTDRQKLFMVISIIMFVWNDITKNELFCFSHEGIGGMIPATIEIIWGHLLFIHKDRLLEGKVFKKPVIWVSGFLGLNLFRSAVQLYEYKTSGSEFILFWYTAIGLLCSMCLMFFAFSFMRCVKNKKFNNAIRKLGSYTFLVYLVHFPLSAFIGRIGLREIITNCIGRISTGVVFDVLYTLIMMTVVFVLSLLVACFIKFIVRRTQILYGSKLK